MKSFILSHPTQFRIFRLNIDNINQHSTWVCIIGCENLRIIARYNFNNGYINLKIETR